LPATSASEPEIRIIPERILGIQTKAFGGARICRALIS
jgi:hypothetical protein